MRSFTRSMCRISSAAVLALAACTIWSARDWERLPDREFVFARFTYANLNAGSRRAFSSMRDFPLGKALEALEKKYRIRIDSSEFQAFIAGGDAGKIREEGVIMTKSYVWESSSGSDKRAELTLKVDIDAGPGAMGFSYELALKTGGRIRAIYADGAARWDDIPAVMLARIGSGAIPDTAATQVADTARPGSISGPARGRRWETEGRIKDQIGDYVKTLSPGDREAFRDDIVRYLGGSAR